MSGFFCLWWTELKWLHQYYYSYKVMSHASLHFSWGLPAFSWLYPTPQILCVCGDIRKIHKEPLELFGVFFWFLMLMPPQLSCDASVQQGAVSLLGGWECLSLWKWWWAGEGVRGHGRAVPRAFGRESTSKEAGGVHISGCCFWWVILPLLRMQRLFFHVIPHLPRHLP